MKKKVAIKWLKQPEAHDYPAAESYLGLLFTAEAAGKMAGKLAKARITWFKAKDVFRASGLSLLGVSNSHVEKNREKMAAGVGLSPILLVRDEGNGKVIVADGYHRMCSVYACDEDAMLPCKII